MAVPYNTFTGGSSKFMTKSGSKFYVAFLVHLGSSRSAKQVFRTATQAQKFADRWARRANRLIGDACPVCEDLQAKGEYPEPETDEEKYRRLDATRQPCRLTPTK